MRITGLLNFLEPLQSRTRVLPNRFELLPPKKNELFCQTYWRSVLAKNSRIYQSDRFSYGDNDFKISLVNRHINGFVQNQTELDPKEIPHIMSSIDTEMRISKFKKISKPRYRGVAEPAYYANCTQDAMNNFERMFNLKEGDIIYLKDYAFVTKSRWMAEQSMKKGVRNILFKIQSYEPVKMLKKGIFHEQAIIQRCSKAICTGTKNINASGKTYKQINIILLSKE